MEFLFHYVICILLIGLNSQKSMPHYMFFSAQSTNVLIYLHALNFIQLHKFI